MPDSTLDRNVSAADPNQAQRRQKTESEKYFEVERREESRKRFATYSFWAGLLSLLLILIPNPVSWLFGPVAILLGIHALVRIFLQPARHTGVARALIGTAIGIIATLVSSR